VHELAEVIVWSEVAHILEQHGTTVMVFERPKAVGTVTLNRIMSLKGALGHP
jgi:hypothetical protein